MLGLRVRRAEAGITLSLAGYFFLIVATHYLIKPARNALFLEGLGADRLPYVYIGTALVTWAVMILYVRVAPGIRLTSLIPRTLFFLCLNLLAFWWFLGNAGEWLQGVFYIWVKVYAVLLPSQFWLLADELMDPRQAKRLFAPIGAGGILGSIVGSLLAWQLARPLGTSALLLAGAGGLLAAFGLVALITSLRRPVLHKETPEPGPTAVTEEPTGPQIGSPGAPTNRRDTGAGTGVGRPLVVTIAVLLTLTIIVHTVVDWQLNKAAELHFTELDERTSFFGQFFTLLNLLTLAIQLLATSFVLRFFGVGTALMLLPLALAFGSAGILLHPGLWTAVFARGADDALRYSVDQSARELLFLPVPSALRQHLKPRIDLMASRLANGIGGLVILAGIWLLDDPLASLSVVSLVVIAVWVVVAQRARRQYADTLQRLLTVQDIDVRHLAQSRLDAGALEAIRQGLMSSDIETILAALALAEHTDPREFVTELREILKAAEETELKRQVLHLLTESGDHSAVGEALENIEQEDSRLRAEALAYAWAAADDPQSKKQIESYLWGEDPLMAASAAVCLLEQADPEQQDKGLHILERAASLSEGTGATRTRVAVAEIIQARPGLAGTDRILERLLRDEEIRVVQAALVAAARHGDARLVAEIVNAGLRRRLQSPALRALRELGLNAVGPLTGTLADPRNSIAVRRLAARALGRIGGEPGAGGLLAGLSAEEPSVRGAALQALNYMLRRGQNVDIGKPGRTMALDTEWRDFLSLHLLTAVLETPGTDTRVAFAAAVVHERLEQAQERLFRALALRYPLQTVFYAYRGLLTRDPTARAHAVELVDSIVDAPLRRPLVQLLEEEKGSARAGIAAAELGVPVPDTATAMRELINPADAWLSACALAALGSDAPPLPEGLTQDLFATGYAPLLEFL